MEMTNLVLGNWAVYTPPGEKQCYACAHADRKTRGYKHCRKGCNCRCTTFCVIDGCKRTPILNANSQHSPLCEKHANEYFDAKYPLEEILDYLVKTKQVIAIRESTKSIHDEQLERETLRKEKAATVKTNKAVKRLLSIMEDLGA